MLTEISLMRFRPDLHRFEAGKAKNTKNKEHKERGIKQTHKITRKIHDGKSQLVPNPLGQLPILFS